MDHYKTVNTELIGKVQEMKLTIGSYKKEIVELRKLFMEEHCLRIELQQNFLNILTRNFQDTLFQIDPQIDISVLFSRMNIKGAREIITSDFDAAERVSDAQRDCVERRSSAGILLKELRRSNSLQQYVNVITRSPTKRRSSNRGSSVMESVAPESETSRTDDEFENSEKVYEEDQVKNDVKDKAISLREQTEQSDKESEGNNEEEYQQQLDVILEHTFEEDEVITDEQNTSSEISQSSSLNNHTIKHTSTILLPLRDVTNQKAIQSQDFIQKAMSSYHLLSPDSPCQVGRSHVQKRRGKVRRIYDDDSIEAPRNAQSFNGRCPDSADDSRKESYNSFKLSTLAMQDITMENFINAPSSTPCQQQQKQRQLSLRNSTLRAQNLKSSIDQGTNDGTIMTNATVATTKNTKINEKNSAWSIDNTTNSSMTTFNTSRTRPQRKCAPKNLAEPNLVNKMRDTSKSKSTKKK